AHALPSVKAAGRSAPARSPRSSSRQAHHARDRDPGVHRLQAPELQYDEEPPEDLRAARVQQVLPVLPQAHGTQGEQVTEVRSGKYEVRGKGVAAPRTSYFNLLTSARLQASSSIGRASVSKTEGWGFDSLLACQIPAHGGAPTS